MGAVKQFRSEYSFQTAQSLLFFQLVIPNLRFGISLNPRPRNSLIDTKGLVFVIGNSIGAVKQFRSEYSFQTAQSLLFFQLVIPNLRFGISLNPQPRNSRINTKGLVFIIGNIIGAVSKC